MSEIWWIQHEEYKTIHNTMMKNRRILKVVMYVCGEFGACLNYTV